MIRIDVLMDKDLEKSIARYVSAQSERAIFHAAKTVRDTWVDLLTVHHTKARLRNPQYGYARGMRILKLSGSHYVISCISPYAGWMEEGEEDADLKKKLPYGNKSRVSRKGVPYLIVPFRQFTPGQGPSGGMSKAAYQKMRKSRFSLVESVDRKVEPNAKGENIFRPTYQWGDRLKETEDENEKGMVSFFDSGTGKKTYLTFRVVSANSPAGSWIRKGRPEILSKVKEEAQKNISGNIQIT